MVRGLDGRDYARTDAEEQDRQWIEQDFARLDALESAAQECYDVLVLAAQDSWGTECFGALDSALEALRPVMKEGRR